MLPQFVSPSKIRSDFSLRMSAIYKTEVPLYAQLTSLVSSVNTATLSRNPQLRSQLEATDELPRLDLERHGAIRLGTADELYTMRRFLAIMGMFPTGYYDLQIAGLPVHATCFRASESAELAACPFRLFTSLLRLDLISNPDAVSQILSKRKIFSDRVLELVDKAEKQGGLEEQYADELVREGLETFKWHSHAAVDEGIYHELLAESPLLADIVAFRGPHINHLTPRTLDIDEVQQRMGEAGIPNKEAIEGPPFRVCPILLRQTSFKAQDERVLFAGSDVSGGGEGTHTARFGEIEQRGAALTPKGRELYDALLLEASRKGVSSRDGEGYRNCFGSFPDTWKQLREQRLVFFQYRVSPELPREGLSAGDDVDMDVDSLVQKGCLAYEPIVYEDFLPISAAGIFRSNLGSSNDNISSMNGNGVNCGREKGDKEGFETALGCKVADEMCLYEAAQRKSLEVALADVRARLRR